MIEDPTGSGSTSSSSSTIPRPPFAERLTLAQRQDLEKRFTYHPPKEGQPLVYELLRSEAKKLAEMMVALTPHSREQALALTNLETSVFWANAAIARGT